MRCKMSNFTLLKTPFCNILNRGLKTRVESSQIWQTLSNFGQSSTDQNQTFKVLSAPKSAPTMFYQSTIHQLLNY